MSIHQIAKWRFERETHFHIKIFTEKFMGILEVESVSHSFSCIVSLAFQLID
jgi:hypothetical protein